MSNGARRAFNASAVSEYLMTPHKYPAANHKTANDNVTAGDGISVDVSPMSNSASRFEKWRAVKFSSVAHAAIEIIPINRSLKKKN